VLNIEFRISVSEDEGSRDRVLRILLWTLIRLNREYLRMNPTAPRLYDSGVRFIREKEGEELWPTIGEVIRMGGGDCEDLACWRVAELLERDHVEARPAWRHRQVKLPSGNMATLYHILVWKPSGFEDPSRLLGMGGPSDR
jgi:hypothetical protein